MLNVRKITDIALKMFNFPFCLCGAHFCSVRWLFKTRFLIFFVKKTLSFIWYIFILMSGDLCWSEDLYLHKKLDGMFVFVSLRHHRANQERRKRAMTIKFIFYYPWNVVFLTENKHRYQREMSQWKGPTSMPVMRWMRFLIEMHSAFGSFQLTINNSSECVWMSGRNDFSHN